MLASPRKVISGDDSLLSEIELIQIYDEVFDKLKIPNIEICINNRKILSGLVELMNDKELFNDIKCDYKLMLWIWLKNML